MTIAFPFHWLSWRFSEDEQRLKSALRKWGEAYASRPCLDRDCSQSVAAAKAIKSDPKERSAIQKLINEADIRGKAAEILEAEIILSSLGLRQVLAPNAWQALQATFQDAPERDATGTRIRYGVPVWGPYGSTTESANPAQVNRSNWTGLDLVRPVQVVGSTPILASILHHLSTAVARILVIAGGAGPFSLYTKPAVEADLRRRKDETLLDVLDTDIEPIVHDAPGKSRHNIDLHHLAEHFQEDPFDLIVGEHAIDVGNRNDLGLRVKQIAAVLNPLGAFAHVHALGLRAGEYQEGLHERDSAFLSELSQYGKEFGLRLLPVLFSRSCILPRTPQFDLHVESNLNVLECRLGGMTRSFDPALPPNQVRLGVIGIVSIMTRNDKLLNDVAAGFNQNPYKLLEIPKEKIGTVPNYPELSSMSLSTRYTHLKIEIEGPMALITLNRPDVLNALNAETKKELAALLNALSQDTKVRVIIITGAGEKAFSAGADINEIKSLTPLEGFERAVTGQALSKQIELLDKPVIAAINGYALGGGCELALACDIRIASENAKLGQPEVNLGLIPGFGGTQRLPRLVGKGKAMELIFTGDMIDAQEALRIGLVEKVVPRETLMQVAKEMALKIAGKGPLAVRFSKKAIHDGLQVDLDRGLALEASYFSTICSTQDKLEGTSAFLEKRKPEFKGK